MIKNNIENLIENKIRIPQNKKFCAIIGSNPSKGARSPLLWNRTFKQMKKEIRMIPIDCKREKLVFLLKALQENDNFIGGAIAAPYKEKVAEWLNNRITKSSKKIGAVNCIFRDRSKFLIGTNTDGEGAIKSIKKKFGSIKNKKVLLMGTGGTAKAITAYLFFEIGKGGSITIAGRKYKKLKFCKLYPKTKVILWKNIPKFVNDFNMIINCTTLGWDKKILKSPISKKLLSNMPKSIKIFDVIYDPSPTIFLKNSIKEGFDVLNGLDMNMQQAVIAFAKVNNMTNKLDIIKKYMNNKK